MLTFLSLIRENNFILLDIRRFCVDNTLIYLISRNFFLNTNNNLQHSPGRKTIDCDKNMFQMFYLFIQQLFIWADCMGSKQKSLQSTAFPRFWFEIFPMYIDVIMSLFTINGGFYGIVLSYN